MSDPAKRIKISSSSSDSSSARVDETNGDAKELKRKEKAAEKQVLADKIVNELEIELDAVSNVVAPFISSMQKSSASYFSIIPADASTLVECFTNTGRLRFRGVDSNMLMIEMGPLALRAGLNPDNVEWTHTFFNGRFIQFIGGGTSTVLCIADGKVLKSMNIPSLHCEHLYMVNGHTDISCNGVVLNNCDKCQETAVYWLGRLVVFCDFKTFNCSGVHKTDRNVLSNVYVTQSMQMLLLSTENSMLSVRDIRTGEDRTVHGICDDICTAHTFRVFVDETETYICTSYETCSAGTYVIQVFLMASLARLCAYRSPLEARAIDCNGTVISHVAKFANGKFLAAGRICNFRRPYEAIEFPVPNNVHCSAVSTDGRLMYFTKPFINLLRGLNVKTL